MDHLDALILDLKHLGQILERKSKLVELLNYQRDKRIVWTDFARRCAALGLNPLEIRCTDHWGLLHFIYKPGRNNVYVSLTDWAGDDWGGANTLVDPLLAEPEETSAI